MDTGERDVTCGSPRATRWAVGLVLLVVFLVVDGALALHNDQEVARTQARVTHTYAVRLALERLLAAVRDAETGQRGYLLSGRDAYLEPYRAGVGATDRRYREVRELTRDDPEQQRSLDEVGHLVERKLGELESTIRARRTLGLEAARGVVLSDEGKRTMDAVREAVDAMQQRERDALAARAREAAAQHRTATLTTLAALALGLALVGMVFLAIARGAAAREAAAASVFLERERLRITLTSIGDGVVVTDEAGRVTLLNDRARELTGHGDEALGRPLDEAFHIVSEATHAPVESPVARALREGAVVGLANHTLLVREDGTELPIDDSGAPIRAQDGSLVGVVLVFRDVRDERRAQAELRRRADALEDEGRRKTEFLGMLSHELRNPLSAIHSGLFVLARAEPGSDAAARALALVRRQATHLGRLVDDLLDVTRISRGKITLQRERLDLAEVARRVADDARPMFAENGIALGVEVAEEPLFIDGDRTRIAQVVGNLLHNSAKFTPRGRAATLSVARDGAEAVVRVRDEGIGLAPEMLSRIFEPFTQADAGLDRASGGLGLGLAVVRALVTLHGGSVGVTSDGLDRGAEFVIRLPTAEGAPAAAAPPAPPRHEGDAGRRVLIIEDNPDAAESLREVLELEGHAAEVVHLGDDGVRVAHAHHPDVVLCDLGLPDRSGYEVARAIRDDPSLDGVTLVALTGYARPEDVARARAAGFDHHLAKPPNLDQLEELLRSSRRRLAA